MTVTMQEALGALQGPQSKLTRALLADLSDLSAEEVLEFKSAWADTSGDNRVIAVKYFVEMAEDNVELDFEAIFRVALEDDSDEVRLGAVTGLWESEDRTLIRPLLRALRDDPAETVRTVAAQVLSRFALMAEMGKLRDRDFHDIGDTLVDVIDDEFESVEVRRRAIESLASMRHPRVPELIDFAYESEDNKVQASALYAMGRTCDVAWMPTLIGELDNDDAEMRYEAAAALGELGEDDAVEFLLPLIGDGDAQVQAAAIMSVGRIGGVAAKNALRLARKGADERVDTLIAAALEAVEFGEDPLSIDLLNQRPQTNQN